MSRENYAKRRTLAVLKGRLPGHTDWVRCIAFSPDGETLASGSFDREIRVWNLKECTCQATLRGHESGVRSVAFSPDGSKIISASYDGTVRIWSDLSTIRPTVCVGHADEVWDVVAIEKGRQVVSVSRDDTLRRWDTDTGRCLQVIKGGGGGISCVSALPNSDELISGQISGDLRTWSLSRGECTAILSGHAKLVNAVRLMLNSNLVVSGSQDKTIKIWDLGSMVCVGTLEGHQGEIGAVDVSPDERLIASVGFNDHMVRLWDFQAKRCLLSFEVDRPISVAISPDGSRLVVGTAENEILVYCLTLAQEVSPPVELAHHYVNAKVVLMGKSGVGKSGLAHRLIDDEFVPTASTHGMRVWRLDLPLGPDNDMEREVLLWDLAGQEDYRLVHQLFLDDTALALVLFNPQEDDPFSELGAWLKILRGVVSRGRAWNVAKLLIAARTDVGGLKVSQAKIDQFREEHELLDYLSTSALSGENCSDRESGGRPSPLKELIARNIPWTLLQWTSTPKLLANLKTALIEVREHRLNRLLRFSELTHRLRQTLPDEMFNELDVRTAVTLLANHGLVMPLKFGDLILLHPETLNGYASAVIRAARNHSDEIGCVTEQVVFDRTINLDGVERLEPADEELLMRAMIQIFLDRSLCIAEETPEGRHLVFPSQYRRDRPIPKHPEILVSYSFSGEWQTIYTTLVVRLWYCREFKHRELWHNAAEFETSRRHTAGLMVELTDEGAGRISIFFDSEVEDVLKVIFIEYVHRHLEKYARDVQRDRRYVCPHCGRPVTDLEAVRERLAAMKYFIYCPGCDEKLPLIDHIEQRLGSDPVALKVLGMDERATRELDSQALEQILTGHMMAICGEANQIFRELTKFDFGIDGEVEFKGNDGRASGKKIYVQLKSGASYLRTRKADGKEVFDVKNPRHLDYWISQPVDVYLVIRDAEETIRWMNVTTYLKGRPEEQRGSRQIVFSGERLDAATMWKVRDTFFRGVSREKGTRRNK